MVLLKYCFTFLRYYWSCLQRNSLLSLLIIFLLLGCASKKAFIKQNLQKAEDAKYLVGFELFDPEKNKVLYSKNTHTYFNPASNTKIFTLYTSLQILQDSIPAFHYQKQNDTLFLKPTGDPTFLHPDFSSEKTLDFLQSNDYSVLAVIPNLFVDDTYGPGWAWEDYAYAFMPERTAMPLYGNVTTIFYDDSLVIKPAVFKSSVATQKAKYPRKRYENSFFIPKELKDTLKIPFINSENLLEKLVTAVTNKETVVKNPLSLLKWQTQFSQPTDSVLIPMMIESDNFLAEQLMMVASSINNDSLSIQQSIKFALDSLLPNLPDKPRWVDGSGLSRYNLFTPDSFVYVLNKLYNEIPDKRKLFTYFPSGGVNGTLKKWYGDEKAFIYAKSGSFSNNYCLSGYLITKSGKTLIFSFMANHFTIPSSIVKQELEALIYHIKDHY